MIASMSLGMMGIHAQTVMRVQERLESMDPADAAHLQSLIADLNLTLYLNEGQITSYGSGSPLVVKCDAASIGLLYESNPQFEQVELIQFIFSSASQLPGGINLDQLVSFSSLQHIYFVFKYNACGNQSDSCLESTILGLLQSTPDGPTGTMTFSTGDPVVAIYKLSIPE